MRSFTPNVASSAPASRATADIHISHISVAWPFRKAATKCSLCDCMVLPNLALEKGARVNLKSLLRLFNRTVPPPLFNACAVRLAQRWNKSGQKTDHTFWLDIWSHAMKPCKGSEKPSLNSWLVLSYSFNSFEKVNLKDNKYCTGLEKNRASAPSSALKTNLKKSSVR